MVVGLPAKPEPKGLDVCLQQLIQLSRLRNCTHGVYCCGGIKISGFIPVSIVSTTLLVLGRLRLLSACHALGMGMLQH